MKLKLNSLKKCSNILTKQFYRMEDEGMDRFIIHNLFGIEGFNIAWYGVIIGCGMILATAVARVFDSFTLIKLHTKSL